MKCDELLILLNEYIDGEIQPGVCAELEKHLVGCNPCQVVVDNIRKTITLYKSGQPYELPPGFRGRLHAEMRAHWKQSHLLRVHQARTPPTREAVSSQPMSAKTLVVAGGVAQSRGQADRGQSYLPCSSASGTSSSSFQGSILGATEQAVLRM